MTYEQAIEKVKQGHKLKRKQWDGAWIALSINNNEIFMDDGDYRQRFLANSQDKEAVDWKWV